MTPHKLSLPLTFLVYSGIVCAACSSGKDQSPGATTTSSRADSTTAAVSNPPARAPGETSDKAAESEAGVQQNAWCNLLKKGGEQRLQEAWFLTTAEAGEADGPRRDTLLCGAEGLKAATSTRDLTKASEIAAAKPLQIGTTADWCEFHGEAHSRVRVYSRVPVDPSHKAAVETLGGVVLLASLEGAAMSAQTSRVDELVRKIHTDGCESAKRDLAK